MADLKGTIRLEDGDSLNTTLMVKSGRLLVVAGEHEIGNWPVDKLAVRRRNNDFHIKAEGEELVIHVDDPVALAQEIGLGMGQVEKAKGRKGRTRRKRKWGAKTVDTAPAPEPVKAGPLSARMASDQSIAPPQVPSAPVSSDPAPAAPQTRPSGDSGDDPGPIAPTMPEPIEITFDEEREAAADSPPDVPEVHEEPEHESGLQPIEFLSADEIEVVDSPLQPIEDVLESEPPSFGENPPVAILDRPPESRPLIERFEKTFSPPDGFADQPALPAAPVPEPEVEPHAPVEVEDKKAARPSFWQRVPLVAKYAGAGVLALIIMGIFAPTLLALLLFVAGMGTLFLAVAAKGDSGSTIMPPPFFGTDLAIFGGIGMVLLAALIMVMA